MSISHLTLFKRSNGIWYIVYQDEGQSRWKSTGKKLKHEALATLKDFAEDSKSHPQTVVLSEFIKEFTTLQTNSLRKSTINQIYLPAFKNFQAHCGDRSLPSYTIKDVELFKSRRLVTCAPTTVNIEFRALRAAFNLAVKWQLLRESVFTRSTQVRISERFPVYFGKEEFRRFIAHIREPFLKDLFLFAALTGLRLGEILNLDWSNVDLERRLIAIANSDSFFTKSGKCRIVPMSDVVFEMLTQKAITRNLCDSVFHARGARLKKSHVQHKFKRYVREAGLDDALRFHSLRHYAESRTMPSGDANSSRLNPFPLANSA